MFFRSSISSFPLIGSVFPRPVPQPEGRDETKNNELDCHEPDALHKIHVSGDDIDQYPEYPGFDFLVDHQKGCDDAHDGHERIEVREGARLSKDPRENFVDVIGQRTEQKRSKDTQDEHDDELFALHVTHAQFMFAILLKCFWMRPPPPSDEVGDEVEDVQKHIRIELYLIKQKEEQHHVDQSYRPIPHDRLCGQPYRYYSSDGAEKFEIAHRVAEDFEENIIDIEEVHKDEIAINPQRGLIARWGLLEFYADIFGFGEKF